MYMDEIETYNKTAKEWVAKYANMEALEAAKIQKLTEMGFTDAQARVCESINCRKPWRRSAGMKKLQLTSSSEAKSESF